MKNGERFIEFSDREFLDEKWAALEKESSPEIVASLKKLYEIYDDGVIDWFAGLYDAKYGGYYFSNSGRDNDGFLPDIESTLQALGYITASGMLMQPGEDSYRNFIPAKMREAVIKFIKERQAPEDGYFYHPQWGKTIAPSRKSRDLMWATGVLGVLGSAPTYDAPNGVKGDGILADGTKVNDFSTDKKESKETANEQHTISLDPRLESADSFLAYLNEKFGEEGTRPLRRWAYAGANELTAFGSVIVARDKELLAEGKPLIAPVLVEWLNERQNEFGHWQYKTDENGNLIKDDNENYVPLNNFDGNNSLLKIITLYNTLGYKMPRTIEAAECAIKAISMEKPDDHHICNVYNTWFALNCIRKTLVDLGEEGAAEYKTLRKRLFELAPEAILITKERLSDFAMPDGSFKYLPGTSSGLSQNAHVGVKGVDEGDVNATRISLNTLKDLYGALDLTDYFVPIFVSADAKRYKKLLEEKDK